MKVLFLTAFAGAALAGGSTLSTKYTTDRALKFEIESTTTMETKTEVEGADVQGMPGGGGSRTETTMAEVHVDRVMETADGKPTKVRRKFEKVGGTSNMTFGENERSRELESPFEGVTIEMTIGKDGEIEYEAVEGAKPEHEKALDGQRLDLFLDALLPKEALEVDGTYDLEKDAIRHGLRLDVRRGMFPPPERPEGQGGGEGGGGRRRGGMRGGGGADGLLDGADWKGTGKLVAVDKDVDGVACAVVELELEASGEREMPEMRGPRRGGAFGPEPVAFENKMTYSATIKGKFYFATKEKRPVKLDLEGKLHTESTMEFTREENTVRMRSTGDGKIEFKVDVTEEHVTEAKSEKSPK